MSCSVYFTAAGVVAVQSTASSIHLNSPVSSVCYEVAWISRLLEMKSLFCKRAL